jgi:GntR family transcriptional repressor for pyruvate dehydrogenase complex
VFEPVELTEIVGLRDAGPARACDLVVDQLRDLIVSGKIKSGTRLPSERELAERFQTSRVTISQALRILAALDLVRIVHGSGVYVVPDPSRLLRSSVDLMLALSRESMIALVELRGWLEVSAIARAAQVRTDADLARIEEALRAMSSERASVERWLRLDGSFHRAIVEATGNGYALTILAAISDLMNAARERTYREAGAAPSWFAQPGPAGLLAVHERIADAIRAGDTAAAREAGLEHQRLVERNVAELDPWADAPERAST